MIDWAGSVLEQGSDWNSQREREFGDVAKRGISARGLDPAKVRAVDACFFREPLLGPALLLPQGANPNRKPPDDDVLGFQPLMIWRCRL